VPAAQTGEITPSEPAAPVEDKPEEAVVTEPASAVPASAETAEPAVVPVAEATPAAPEASAAQEAAAADPAAPAPLVPGTPDAAQAPAAHAEPEAPAGQPAPSEADLASASEHLAREAQAGAQTAHSRFHIPFARHRPKAVTTAAVLLVLVLGGGSGAYYAYQLKSGGNPQVASTWVSFAAKDSSFSAMFVKAPAATTLVDGQEYIRSESFGEYGVRVLNPGTSPDEIISGDVNKYGGVLAKQSYKTAMGQEAIRGTITGRYSGRPVVFSFEFLTTSKKVYEIYTLGYGNGPAPNTQYFFTTFKPAS
jgi:hypothetical protein